MHYSQFSPMESMLTCWINITISTVGSCWWTLLSCLLSQLTWSTEPAGRRLFNVFSRQRCGKSSQKHTKKEPFTCWFKTTRHLRIQTRHIPKVPQNINENQLKLISGSWRISINGVMEASARHFSGALVRTQNDGCFGRKESTPKGASIYPSRWIFFSI